MRTLRLALKNLLRNRRRTLLTTTSVIAGVGVFILGQGFIGGLEENIIVAAIDTTVGHVMARPANYPPGFQRPLDVLLELKADTRQMLDRSAVTWTERTFFAPIAASDSESLRVSAIGYDPERDEKVFPRTGWAIDGRYPMADKDEVLVGPGVARLLRVKPGDHLVLQIRTHPGALNALSVAVTGVVTTHNMALDGLGIFVPQALTRRLIAADAPTHISVKLAHRDDADAFAPKLQAALGSQAEVVSWRQETAELLRLQNIRRQALNIIVFILMALAAFGIANTILMAAYERTREVGTLRALGMTEGGVARLFLIEGSLMGWVGGLLGALWGGGLVAHWAKHPIDFTGTAASRGNGNVSFSALVYTQVQPGTILLALGMGVVVATIASIYPARVASALLPADAVRAS